MTRVALDFDGTLAARHGLVIDLINYKRGTAYTVDDIKHWDWWTDVGLEEDFWAIYDLMERTHMLRAVRPVSEWAAPAVKNLIRHGFEVELLTSNNPRLASEITAWMFGHGLDVPVKAIGRVGAHQKAEMDYDVFIDDAPALAEAMGDFPDKALLLIDQPWNRDVLSTQNVVRVKDWRQVPSLLGV